MQGASRSAASGEDRSPLAQAHAAPFSDVALALIGDPELVFLDEHTTGFDPSARRSAWEMIDGLDRPDGGSRAQIGGAVAGGSHELASDPEHWTEALGTTPPA